MFKNLGEPHSTGLVGPAAQGAQARVVLTQTEEFGQHYRDSVSQIILKLMFLDSGHAGFMPLECLTFESGSGR